MNQPTTHCSYCTTVPCKGCQVKMREPTYIVSPQTYSALKPLIYKQKRLKSYKINV